MKNFIIKISRVILVLIALFGINYPVFAQTYYYSGSYTNYSNPYYRSYQCGENGYGCGNGNYYTIASAQSSGYSYPSTQTASVINSAPQLPNTGGGGRDGGVMSGDQTSIMLIGLSALVASVLLIIALWKSRLNNEKQQLAI